MSESLNELREIVSVDMNFALRVLEDVTLRGRGVSETLAGRAVRAHKEAALHVVRNPDLWRRRGDTSISLLTLAICKSECAALEALEDPRIRQVSGALRTAYRRHASVRTWVTDRPETWQTDGLWYDVLRGSPELAVRTADELIAARSAGRPEDAPITWADLLYLARLVPPVGLLFRLSVAHDDASDAELEAELRWHAEAGRNKREAVILLCQEASGWLAGRRPRILAFLLQSEDPDLRAAALRAAGQMR